MRTAAVAVVLSCFASLFLVPVVASAQDAQPKRTISTSGEAVVYVVPDEVIVNLGVEVYHKDLDQAVRTSDEQAKQLLAAIKGLGVETSTCRRRTWRSRCGTTTPTRRRSAWRATSRGGCTR